MMLKKVFLIGLICAFLAPINVFAEKGKWSFTPYIGAVGATSRDILNFDSQTVTTTAKTFSNGDSIAAGGVLTTTGDISLNDSHDTPLLTGFDVGYFISDDLEVFGGFEYVTAGSNTLNLVTVTTAFNIIVNGFTDTIAVGDTMFGEAENYYSWAIKIGATKYFPIVLNHGPFSGTYTPYVGGYGGFKHINAMDMIITFSQTGIDTFSIKYLEATNTGYFGFHTGVNKEMTLGSGPKSLPVSLGVRARFDYSPDFNDDDADIGGTGINNSINDVGSGFDFSLTGTLSIPF